ncbi:MAG: tyrosine-type recombinase/integrase [Deltaproteobacteria bacterium]|nr:tyrosine-type recombinase/integrase [Deltaproteobacteria bacterium]
MREQKRPVEFCGPLAIPMKDFLHEKRAMGYRFHIQEKVLLRLDRFLIELGHGEPSLPKTVVEKWTRKNPNESPRSLTERIYIIRQLGEFLVRHGMDAYLPDPKLAPLSKNNFSPYIFSREQIKLFLQTADNIRPHSRYPFRHIVMPLIFKLLYYCGLRLSEATHLRVIDVDLKDGILTIRQGKFRKDRLVPMAPTLVGRFRNFADSYRTIADDTDIFLPAPDGGPYSNGAVYHTFREVLRKCGIPHGGRGKGPRVHDIRHTHAVHNLHEWYRQDVDLNVALPILATYMGHQNVAATQRYLRLTAEIYPDLVRRMSKSLGHIIPKED